MVYLFAYFAGIAENLEEKSWEDWTEKTWYIFQFLKPIFFKSVSTIIALVNIKISTLRKHLIQTFNKTAGKHRHIIRLTSKFFVQLLKR